MEKISLKEQRILYELEKNARQSISSIAKKIRLSKQLTAYKLKKLEGKGVIQGYHAIIDTTKMGYTTYRCYLHLQYTNLRIEKEFMNYLMKIPEIAMIVTIDGRWDVGFGIMVKEIYDFYSVWEKIMTDYGKIIENYDISIYSPIYYFTKTFLSPKLKEISKEYIYGGHEKITYDKLDKKILLELAPNIRKPIAEIASKLEKSTQLILNRIKSLEKKKIIQGYLPIYNWGLLGFEYYKVDLNLKDYKKKQEIFKFCKQQKYIFQISRTIGGSDFEFELYAKNKKHFHEIMNSIKEKFSEEIKNYTYFNIIKTFKEDFFPSA